jgi:hypothetical protein
MRIASALSSQVSQYFFDALRAVSQGSQRHITGVTKKTPDFACFVAMIDREVSKPIGSSILPTTQSATTILLLEHPIVVVDGDAVFPSIVPCSVGSTNRPISILAFLSYLLGIAKPTTRSRHFLTAFLTSIPGCWLLLGLTLPAAIGFCALEDCATSWASHHLLVSAVITLLAIVTAAPRKGWPGVTLNTHRYFHVIDE